MIEAEEEDYFNADDDDEISPVTPLFPRGQAPSPPMNSLKRKRRTGLNISTGFRPTITPPRTPPIGSLVDYEDEEDDQSGQVMLGANASASLDPLSSPRLSNRQITPPIPPRRPSPDEEEDDLLESLVRSKGSSPLPTIVTPTTPDISMGGMKPGEKRRREDDDDELLERLASKAKRPDLGTKVFAASGRAGSKPGDDPPKKIKLKFGLTSLGATPSSSPSSMTPSEVGVKDGDTG